LPETREYPYGPPLVGHGLRRMPGLAFRKKENSQMKIVYAAIAALALIAAPVAMAQTPAKLSVETTKIAELVKNPAAKAALEKALPEIAPYYEQIGEMTLKEVAPMSQGAIDDEKLKALQVEFDKIK
jgi:hypothetical protein